MGLRAEEDLAPRHNIDLTCGLNVEVIAQDHFDELNRHNGAQGHTNVRLIDNAIGFCGLDGQHRAISTDRRDDKGGILTIDIVRRPDGTVGKAFRNRAEIGHNQGVTNLKDVKGITAGIGDGPCELAGTFKTHKAAGTLPKGVQ